MYTFKKKWRTLSRLRLAAVVKVPASGLEACCRPKIRQQPSMSASQAALQH
jgi:hypothetical protein